MSAPTVAADAQELRRLIITMLEKAGSGHAAGALGLADVFAVLYRRVLRYRSHQPEWALRDRLFLSNGHTCPVLYAALAHYGFFPAAKLDTLRQLGTDLQGHPHQQIELGIEITSGPLGQGLSQGVGAALAVQRLYHPAPHIYVVQSDGEQQAGAVWEAYQAGAKYQLANLTTIIDRNYIQINGVTEQIMPIDSLSAKLSAFGWAVYEVNGHNLAEIETALLNARDDGQPSAVICYTEPGHGVDFMSAKFSWHGQAPDPQQAQQALRELHSLGGRWESYE